MLRKLANDDTFIVNVVGEIKDVDPFVGRLYRIWDETRGVNPYVRSHAFIPRPRG